MNEERHCIEEGHRNKDTEFSTEKLSKLKMKYSAYIHVSVVSLMIDRACASAMQLFVQLKGDMVLKVVERNQHRDVVIKQGEVI